MKIDKKHLLNYSILIPYLILSIVGLIIVYSTTSDLLVRVGANPFSSVINQLAFWILSLIAIAFIFRLRLNFLKNGRLLHMALVVEAILLVIAKLFTEAVNGANGWIKLGPITFQPAEYLKVMVVWYLAYTFARLQNQIKVYDYQVVWRRLYFPHSVADASNQLDWRFIILLLIALVAIQPDLGNATIVVLTAVIMYSLSGVAYRWFSGLLSLIVVGSITLITFIRIIGVEHIASIPLIGHVSKRLTAFFNPFEDLTDSGLQLANSYYAMSNGGWFGRGLGNSIEKGGYLPEAQTDFVFAIVIEELGLIGAILILAILFFLILRIFVVGLKAKNPFNAMMAAGVGAMMLMQVFVNIGGISGLIPSTGVTFPFLSQGGNSLLILSVAIGVVLNIDANEKRDDIEREMQAYQEEQEKNT